MKKVMTICLLMSLVLTNFLNPQAVSKVHAQTTASKSTWLWHTAEIATKSAELLHFASANGVNIIYLQVNKNVAIQHYKDFIKSAAEKGIKVYALDGAPNWVAPKGAIYQDQFFQWVTEYQEDALPIERFSGVHLDIEPYLYTGWNSNYKKTVLAYQNLISKAAAASSSLGLTFGVDMPFWFDERMYNNTFGKGTLSSWVISKVDTTTVMVYRDQATGANGIIDLVRNEMNDANKQGKKIEIAVETLQSSEGDFISFYEEGQFHMDSQLNLVETEFSGYSSFQGFGIHYLQSWMNLKP
ncbi:hypothetical protein [Litchfieldia alkalitelluris]|uniref:hypothetical protein n=1 Tax=Litchfieldia alkalitelluris TaxID=304268 RepID=UPI0009971F37|nr:hypothetical protein [Litchfieldia alkalitelluris]